VLIILEFINVTVRVESNVKKQGEQILNELGLNMTSAFNIFLRTVVRERKIPLELSLAEVDPVFNEANLTRLALSKKQIAEGNIIYKTADELGLDDE
jgi:DNA-damage-inducible protein J